MAKPALVEKTYPLVGIFDTANAAERAYESCLARGYELGQINVVVSEGTRQKLLASDSEIQGGTLPRARRKAASSAAPRVDALACS